MTMVTNTSTHVPESPIVPKELGGKWIAWTFDGSRSWLMETRWTNAKRRPSKLARPTPGLRQRREPMSASAEQLGEVSVSSLRD